MSLFSEITCVAGSLHAAESEETTMETDLTSPQTLTSSGDKLFPIFYKETAQADSLIQSPVDKNKGKCKVFLIY